MSLGLIRVDKRQVKEEQPQYSEIDAEELSVHFPTVQEAAKDEEKRKRGKQQPLHLTTEQQDDVIQWFQEHELLYNKGHADYRLTERKAALWRDKAQELGICDGQRLKCWVESLRTQYGKLTKWPSGSGGRLSDRDKWILDKFFFISKHIYRVPCRGGVDLASKIREKHPEWLADCQDSEEGEGEGADKSRTSSPAMSAVSGETSAPAAAMTDSTRKRKRNSCIENTTAFLQHLDDQEKLSVHLSVSTDPGAAERYQWAQWFGAAISDIDEALWPEFQAESLRLVNTFKARSRRVQPTSVQPTAVQPTEVQPTAVQPTAVQPTQNTCVDNSNEHTFR